MSFSAVVFVAAAWRVFAGLVSCGCFDGAVQVPRSNELELWLGVFCAMNVAAVYPSNMFGGPGVRDARLLVMLMVKLSKRRIDTLIARGNN
jgi:hypothetical protein